MGLASTVAKLSGPVTVTRRGQLTYTKGRPDPVSEQAAILDAHLQRETGAPTRLVRTLDGDETATDTRLWVTDKALAAAYDPADPLKTPLGWTELLTAPPEDADGPGADLVDWEGRRFEVTEKIGWEIAFSGDPGFQRYVIVERGAAP